MFRLGGVLNRLVSSANKSSAVKHLAGSVFSQRLVAKKPSKNVIYTPFSRLKSSISFKYPTTVSKIYPHKIKLNISLMCLIKNYLSRCIYD